VNGAESVQGHSKEYSQPGIHGKPKDQFVHLQVQTVEHV